MRCMHPSCEYAYYPLYYLMFDVMRFFWHRSFYTSDRFADIPFPPSEDWEAATGEVIQ